MDSPGSARFLDTAASLGARLCRDAYWSDARCTWIGAGMEPIDGAWGVVYRTLGPDLYGGTSGVALFLARLHAATGERAFRTTAEGAMLQALARESRVGAPMRPSFFSGVAGVTYALVTVGEALGRDDLVADGLARLAAVAAEPLAPDAELDVVSGVAGTIPALLSVHRRYPSDALLDAATRYGDAIVQRAHRADGGASWGTAATASTYDLTGFAHGAAGIAHALLELFVATEDPRYRDSALDAFRYERRWLNTEHGNWADLREYTGAGAPTYGLAWCHGAPGIGLSRVRAFELLGDPALRDDATLAARTTAAALPAMAEPPYGNFSLCHGAAGNAELLLELHRVTGDAAARETAERAGATGIERYADTGAPWPGGITGGGDSPSLMLGAAGTGYFYLRLADPEGTPPIVVVRPEADARAVVTS